MTGDRSAYRILFVCTANICRSAYADVLANRRAPSGVEFASAGVRGLVGYPIDPPMAHHLREGDDIAAHRARQLTRQLASEADLILAMATEHRRYILDEWPAFARKTFVIGHAARELAATPADVTLDGLAAHLWRHRTSDPGDSVPDPYARGPQAAATAASLIDGHVDAILTRLAALAPGPGDGGGVTA
ncbi:MAG: low molecular weight phosphatase family protein [Nigerium sp.]|nr:low molecular weight phosphatase family protein [Nigerium sp.]